MQTKTNQNTNNQNDKSPAGPVTRSSIAKKSTGGKIVGVCLGKPPGLNTKAGGGWAGGVRYQGGGGWGEPRQATSSHIKPENPEPDEDPSAAAGTISTGWAAGSKTDRIWNLDAKLRRQEEDLLAATSELEAIKRRVDHERWAKEAAQEAREIVWDFALDVIKLVAPGNR